MGWDWLLARALAMRVDMQVSGGKQRFVLTCVNASVREGLTCVGISLHLCRRVFHLRTCVRVSVCVYFCSCACEHMYDRVLCDGFPYVATKCEWVSIFVLTEVRGAVNQIVNVCVLVKPGVEHVCDCEYGKWGTTGVIQAPGLLSFLPSRSNHQPAG